MSMLLVCQAGISQCHPRAKGHEESGGDTWLTPQISTLELGSPRTRLQTLLNGLLSDQVKSEGGAASWPFCVGTTPLQVLGYCLQICGSRLMSLRLDGSWVVEPGTRSLEPGLVLPRSLLHGIVMLKGQWTRGGMSFLGACITLGKGIQASVFFRRF